MDIKTAWIIQGLGHGHEDVTKIKDDTEVLSRSDTSVTAGAKPYHFTEITGENVGSFHFHGDSSIYPITAVAAVPKDAKSGTILRGRYLSGEEGHQIVRPVEVIDGLLQSIFRIKNVLDAVISVVGWRRSWPSSWYSRYRSVSGRGRWRRSSSSAAVAPPPPGLSAQRS
ncbi:MAG: hypothetical protein GTN70_01150 [Deltaproteobacteria bacterium]|nr:hypothetical protein [Deltaproteobacteria bacterium]NIS76259.1 hypothetical protein [Deltaproteobacteria bacterium]